MTKYDKNDIIMTKLDIRQKNSDPRGENLQKCSLYHSSVSKNVDFLFKKPRFSYFFWEGVLFGPPKNTQIRFCEKCPFGGLLGI